MHRYKEGQRRGSQNGTSCAARTLSPSDATTCGETHRTTCWTHISPTRLLSLLPPNKTGHRRPPLWRAQVCHLVLSLWYRLFTSFVIICDYLPVYKHYLIYKKIKELSFSLRSLSLCATALCTSAFSCLVSRVPRLRFLIIGSSSLSYFNLSVHTFPWVILYCSHL